MIMLWIVVLPVTLLTSYWILQSKVDNIYQTTIYLNSLDRSKIELDKASHKYLKNVQTLTLKIDSKFYTLNIKNYFYDQATERVHVTIVPNSFWDLTTTSYIAWIYLDSPTIFEWLVNLT